ncbi:MAG TPA: hypothetical protein VEK79_24535 [Thermoanaerobaculia bacterium]|nr:hypothetical protein [Thermoanaerobaculia bacterium]
MIELAPRAAAILFGVVSAHERPWLLPANVCDIVPQTLRAAGRMFELVDIDPATLEPSREQIIDRARDCAGVVFVRTYGAIYDAEAFFASLKLLRDDFVIVDDRCLCRPDVDGELVSQDATVTLFSTGYAKYVDLGGGGFAHAATAGRVTPEAAWREYRAQVLAELARVDAIKEHLNAIYRAIIPEEVQLPAELCSWRFNIRVARAEELLRAITDAGLFASRHYAPLEGGFPHATRLHEEIVNLFNDRYFNEEKATRTAEIVRHHVMR